MTEHIASPHFSGLDISLGHTMPALVAHAARVHGDKPFLIGEDGTATSFASFEQDVRTFARALIAHGVEHGDRVAIWAPNSPQWAAAASAIECIGAVMVPINTRFKGGEAGQVLGKVRARVLFTIGEFLGNDYTAMLQGACGGPSVDRPVANLPELAHIVTLDAEGLSTFCSQQASEALLAVRWAAVTPADIADILFTSGTTGVPKGAMHNHGQALWMVGHWNRANSLHADDRMLLVNPFFHSFGYRSGWVSALAAGITAYPLAQFDAARVLDLIERETISVLMGPPTLFHSLLDHVDFTRRDLSSLRIGHTGAADVPVDLIRAGYEAFGFEAFLTSFGQTESTALISVNTPGEPIETIARTVGRPLPGVELCIVEDTGELLVRGPNVMQGYFEETEQTAETIDPEGWLHTGDVGEIGEDGALRIRGRLKDVVIVGGFNAYPAEIEATLRLHHAIADAAVIAWPDERMGEVCAACIILEAGRSLDLAELTSWARERMANYKTPRHLFILEEFPKTPLGKVQKHMLAQRLTLEGKVAATWAG